MDGTVRAGNVDETWTAYQGKLDAGFLVSVGEEGEDGEEEEEQKDEKKKKKKNSRKSVRWSAVPLAP